MRKCGGAIFQCPCEHANCSRAHRWPRGVDDQPVRQRLNLRSIQSRTSTDPRAALGTDDCVDEPWSTSPPPRSSGAAKSGRVSTRHRGVGSGGGEDQLRLRYGRTRQLNERPPENEASKLMARASNTMRRDQDHKQHIRSTKSAETELWGCHRNDELHPNKCAGPSRKRSLCSFPAHDKRHRSLRHKSQTPKFQSRRSGRQRPLRQGRWR